MEKIEIMTEDKFKEIYQDEELRNAVAFAHIVCKSNGEEEYKKALMYPISYKVTEEQIKIANELREKRRIEVERENKNNLLFCGMGMNFKPEIPDGVGNHRIRTTFFNNEGVKCFIEVGTGRDNNLRVDFAIYDYTESENKDKKNKYNYKNLESEKLDLKYTYANVLELVNKYFNCSFKKCVVDYFNVEIGVICRSEKWHTH